MALRWDILVNEELFGSTNSFETDVGIFREPDEIQEERWALMSKARASHPGKEYVYRLTRAE